MDLLCRPDLVSGDPGSAPAVCTRDIQQRAFAPQSGQNEKGDGRRPMDRAGRKAGPDICRGVEKVDQNSVQCVWINLLRCSPNRSPAVDPTYGAVPGSLVGDGARHSVPLVRRSAIHFP